MPGASKYKIDKSGKILVISVVMFGERLGGKMYLCGLNVLQKLKNKTRKGFLSITLSFTLSGKKTILPGGKNSSTGAV